MKILFHCDFEKNHIKLRSSEKLKLKERLRMFAEDPFNSILGNHALKGKYRGCRSISVGGDLRAIYEVVGKEEYFFITI
jgi:addiction module RelE/StbE family toxin